MPAIPASGAISLSDFATEFGGTPPHSMSEYYRNGANVPSNNSNVPTAGAFRFGQMRGAINEIILAATSGANVDLSSLFGANWTSTVPKRLTIGSGVTIGGTGSSAAIIIPSNMAGTLEIDNAGSILGFGGAANGGAGGNAIQNSASGVTINNTGLLAGGGGGGGLGGTGGQGSTSVLTYYFNWNESYIWKNHQEDNWAYYKWAGGPQINIPRGTTVHNGHYRGSVVDSGPNPAAFYIGRYVTSYFNGGSGGSGGVGQGYNQSNTSGSSGSSGGTNAGTGGTGGSGAAYGTAGSTGATGANGNSSNGSGGASGGAAGAAVTGTSVTMNNTGTLAGAVA